MVRIPYRGKGLLVPLAFFLGLIGGEVIESLAQRFGFGNLGRTKTVIVTLLSAGLNALFTFLFVRNEPGISEAEFEQLVAETKAKYPNRNFGRLSLWTWRVYANGRSHFFLLANRWWTLVISLAGLYAYFAPQPYGG